MKKLKTKTTYIKNGKIFFTKESLEILKAEKAKALKVSLLGNYHKTDNGKIWQVKEQKNKEKNDKNEK